MARRTETTPFWSTSVRPQFLVALAVAVALAVGFFLGTQVQDNMENITNKHNKTPEESKGETVDGKIDINDLPPNAVMSFDNDGNIVVKNRAYRRNFVSLYPKSSQLRKKGKRKKNKQMSTKGTGQELREMERAFAKLRNKLKRADLDYTVQVSINSTDPQTVVYACQMVAPANNLAPIRIIATSASELMAKIKVATENIDLKAVEIAYHKAQIDACDRTKLGHQERLAEIEIEASEETENVETEETNTDNVEKQSTCRKGRNGNRLCYYRWARSSSISTTRQINTISMGIIKKWLSQ